MFLNFYGLTDQPFGVTPNPRYLYLTPTHREAMASIFYGVIENRGFTSLIAPPGMGKTTLLFELLQRCGTLKTIFLFQFQSSPEGLMRSLLAELGIDSARDITDMQEQLNQAILREAAEGKRLVIVVDEAQNFSEPVLETLRMLSNFETSHEKLVHIILAGQPQLAEKLLAPSLAQLRQRISIVASLTPLDSEQTQAYIAHRLRIAGYASSKPLFTGEASELIAQYSGGIPRNINNLCFNALSFGCSLKRKTIERELIEEVHRDLDLQHLLAESIGIQSHKQPAVASTTAAIPVSRRRPAGRALVRTAIASSFISLLCLAGVFATHRLNTRHRLDNDAITLTPAIEKIDADHMGEPDRDVVSTDTQVAPTLPVKLTESPAPNPATFHSVQLAQGETLYELCMKHFGAYNEALIKQIRELNPGLHNPKQMRPGQIIRIPVASGAGEKLTVTNRPAAAANSGEAQ